MNRSSDIAFSLPETGKEGLPVNCCVGFWRVPFRAFQTAVLQRGAQDARARSNHSTRNALNRNTAREKVSSMCRSRIVRPISSSASGRSGLIRRYIRQRQLGAAGIRPSWIGAQP